MTLKKDSLKNPIKIMMVAAEDSSATYATQLLKTWKAKGQDVEAFGVGNREMESLGFEIVGRTEELAVMGLQEILAHWPVIKKAFYGLVEKAKKEKPDLVLLMDYPEFNLRLAKKLKELGIPVVYYISPQIWAWRTYRVHKIKKLVDLMLVIFPFEKDFYGKYGVPSEFVGHPLLDLLGDLLPTNEEVKDERKNLAIGPDKKILGLMPGSRRSELKHNLAVQIETAQKVQKQDAQVEPVIFVAPGLDDEFVRAEAAKLGYRGKMIKESPFKMIALADVILCASGTATLMVGLCQKPMVIMYKMNAFSAAMARVLVNRIPYFGMVNLILQKEAVPERFQSEANADELSSLLLKIVSNGDGMKTEILRQLQVLKEKLGDGGGISRLAEAIENFVQKRRENKTGETRA